MKDFTKTLGAKVDDQTYAECIRLAEQQGINKSDLVRKAIFKELHSFKSTEMMESQLTTSLSQQLPPVSTIRGSENDSDHIGRSAAGFTCSMKNQVCLGLALTAVAVLICVGIR